MQPAVPALSLAEARRLRQVQKQHQTQAIASALSTQSSDAQRKHQRECCFDDESDDEEQRQHEQRKREDHFDVDPDMKKAIENFAGLVAKNPAVQAVAEAKGRNDPKFRFLFDHDSPEFIYYKIQLDKCRQTLPPPEAGTVPALDAPPTDLRRQLPHLFQNPQVSDDGASTDSLSKMKEVLEAQKARAALEIPQEEKEARQERLLEMERRRAIPKAAQEETHGHHITDFLPPEVLNEFLRNTPPNMPKPPLPTSDTQKIDSGVGHDLLVKMGWSEGKALAEGGLKEPLPAGQVRTFTRGLGAEDIAEPQPGDDEYELYRKLTMVAYRHRPNPLGNPRKKYY